MEKDIVVKVEKLSKKFTKSIKRTLVYGTIDTLKSMVGIRPRTNVVRKGEFWALQDINFQLTKGETLGIIGENGSGKSTLLRILTGIFPPDVGEVAIKGKVGSLIAVGAGFHPHMSGRENIYLNGAILGMSQSDIETRFNDIVDFCEIGDFLDAPVSTYSSGMRVKLGFAIAIHSDPSLLIVDEVLSVGDLAFRNKSLRAMESFRKKSNGVIFVSHNLEQVRNLCDRVIVLNEGRVVYEGTPQDAIAFYEDLSRDVRVEGFKKTSVGKTTQSGEIQVKDLNVLNSKGEPTSVINLQEPFSIEYFFDLEKPQKDLYFSAGILNEELRQCIWVISNDNERAIFKDNKPGEYKLTIKFPKNDLNVGVYVPNIAIRNGETGETFERLVADKTFKITSSSSELERGFIYTEPIWELIELN